MENRKLSGRNLQISPAALFSEEFRCILLILVEIIAAEGCENVWGQIFLPFAKTEKKLRKAKQITL